MDACSCNPIMYRFHGSMVERPHSIRGGACSIPCRYIVFKLGLSPSQDENAALLNVLKKGCWGGGGGVFVHN